MEQKKKKNPTLSGKQIATVILYVVKIVFQITGDETDSLLCSMEQLEKKFRSLSHTLY